MKKEIKVVAAVILNEQKEIFSAERAYGFLKGKWEFPGGKVEEGESDEDALKREIKEELSSEIKIRRFYRNVRYEYPEFILNRNCYLCSLVKGNLARKENIHRSEAFHPIEGLKKEDWCPADQLVVNKLIQEGI